MEIEPGSRPARENAFDRGYFVRFFNSAAFPAVRNVLKIVFLLTLVVSPLAAQNLLLTEYKGKHLPVVRARDSRPFVEVDGKQVAADGRRFALHKVAEYWPVYIAIHDIEVSTFHVDMSGSEINHEFRMRARLETPYTLDDVFIVLELDTDSAGKLIFLTEVGNMEPRVSKYLSLRVPMSSSLGEGRYFIHLFSKGFEVLHSNLDPVYRDAVLDAMTQKRIILTKDASPKVFMGPQPEYPAAMAKKKIRGEVMVSLRIGANGRVYDPKIEKASDPAFGEAALTAVRLWRFFPKIKEGRAVETVASLPLIFVPPEEKKKS